ncbi:MAG: hypothetical protein R2932_03550 [Caldilineaceae bacterium]
MPRRTDSGDHGHGRVSRAGATLYAPGGAAMPALSESRIAEQETVVRSAIALTGTHYLAISDSTEAASASAATHISYTLQIGESDFLPIPQACGVDSAAVDYGPIQVGSRVILGRHRAVNGSENWAAEMAQYVGRIAVVTSLSGTDGAGCPQINVDLDNGRYVWRIRDMQLVGK